MVAAVGDGIRDKRGKLAFTARSSPLFKLFCVPRFDSTRANFLE